MPRNPNEPDFFSSRSVGLAAFTALWNVSAVSSTCAVHGNVGVPVSPNSLNRQVHLQAHHRSPEAVVRMHHPLGEPSPSEP